MSPTSYRTAPPRVTWGTLSISRHSARWLPFDRESFVRPGRLPSPSSRFSRTVRHGTRLATSPIRVG